MAAPALTLAHAVISTILVTFAFGLGYIVSFLTSIVDFNNTTGGPFALNYNPAAQILWDAHETRYGNGVLQWQRSRSGACMSPVAWILR